MTLNYKVEKGLSRLLEDLSNENLVYTFKDEILQMHKEKGRPCMYFNNTIVHKLRNYDILDHDETSGRSRKTIVTEKGLKLVRKFSKMGDIRERQVFTE